MDNIVYLNGKYLKAKDATLSIFDRGMLFGDAIYEVIPVYRNRPLFLEKHLERLEKNLKKIKIKPPNINWLTLCEELIAHNRKPNGFLQLYVQVTRGNETFRKHDIPSCINPSVFAFPLFNIYPSLEQKRQGLHACLVEDYRWLRCDIKTTSMLGNVLMNDEAIAQGADTALLTRNGFLTEGVSSNVFIVQKNIIKTPPLSHLCLNGITREIFVELIKQKGFPFQEEPIPVQALFDAEEVWITSTSKEIFPITQINTHHIRLNEKCYWEPLHHAYYQLIDAL